MTGKPGTYAEGGGLAVAVFPGSALPHGESTGPDTSREWAHLCKLARREIGKLLSLVPDVLRDEDRMAIHNLRVSTRRVEQLLDLLYPKPRPKYVRKFRREIRQCRHTLGRIRDCDVLLGVAENGASQVKNANELAWAAVEAYLKEKRERRAPSVFGTIGRTKFAHSYLRLKRDLDSTSCSEMAPESEIAELGENWGSELVHRRLLHSLEHRWRRFVSAVEDSRNHQSEPVIHGVRIAGKRLRVLVELMERLNIPGSSEALLWLRTLQQAIGGWHDLEILDHMIKGMLADRELRKSGTELAGHIEKLRLESREIKRASQVKFWAMTHESPEYRRTKTWVSALLAEKAQK